MTHLLIFTSTIIQFHLVIHKIFLIINYIEKAEYFYNSHKIVMDISVDQHEEFENSKTDFLIDEDEELQQRDILMHDKGPGKAQIMSRVNQNNNNNAQLNDSNVTIEEQQQHFSQAEQATINTISSMSLLNQTALQNNDNFENTREEINLHEEDQHVTPPKGQKKSKRPIDLLEKPAVISDFRKNEGSDHSIISVVGENQKRISKGLASMKESGGSNSNNDKRSQLDQRSSLIDSARNRKSDNPLDPLSAIGRQKSKMSQVSSQHKSIGGKSNISSESMKKSATKSKDMQNSKRTSDISKKADKSLQDVLNQNDHQMQKSHQTESQKAKSKKSPGGASHSQLNQSDMNPNDLSGQGLKLNTSLDRSGGNLLGQPKIDITALPHNFALKNDLSGINLMSDMSRLHGSQFGIDPFAKLKTAQNNLLQDVKPNKNEEQQRDSTDTQKQTDYQILNNTQINQMITQQNKANLAQGIQNRSMLADQALLNLSLQNGMAQMVSTPMNQPRKNFNFEMVQNQANSPGPSDQDQIEFLKSIKKECEKMQKQVAVEAKQKVKFLILNAIQVKKLKQLESIVKEAQDVMKNIKEQKAKLMQNNDTVDQWVNKVDKIFENMKEYVKPQLQLKDQDMALIGKITIAQQKQKNLNQSKLDEKSDKIKLRMKRVEEAYMSPDDGIPDKQFQSIYERSQMLMDETKPEFLQDLSKTEFYEKNSLYQLEHDNSQLRAFNQPLLKQFRAGPSLSRMGMGIAFPGDDGFGFTPNQSPNMSMSAISITNLNRTKQAAMNRDLMNRAAYQGIMKNNNDSSYMNVTQGLSISPQMMNTPAPGVQNTSWDKSMTNKYQSPPSHSQLNFGQKSQINPDQFNITSGIASSDPNDSEISRALPAYNLNKSIFAATKQQDLTQGNIQNAEQMHINNDQQKMNLSYLVGQQQAKLNQSYLQQQALLQTQMRPVQQRLDNTILFSQLGGGQFNPNFATPNVKYMDQNHINRQGFGLDMSNILGALSDNFDKSGIVANGDMSKLFAQGDKSMSFLQSKQNVNGMQPASLSQLIQNQNGTNNNSINKNSKFNDDSMLFDSDSQMQMNQSQMMDQKNEHSQQSRSSQDQKQSQDQAMKHDLSRTMVFDGPKSNDLDQTNLNDMTVSNVDNLEILKESSDMPPEDDGSKNYGTNTERNEVDQMNPDNNYNQSRFIRNRGDTPSMQVIMEESRVENETTIDNQGDASFNMDKADSQIEHGTDNILKGIDSENNFSVNNDRTEGHKQDQSQLLQKSALQDVSSMTPKSSDVSKVIKFFDGPGPDYLNKSKFSMKGYSSNQYMTQPNNTSFPSDFYNRVDTITSDFDSMPFPLRSSENTTERNFFLEHIMRIDSLRNFDSSEAASKIDQFMRERAKTSRVINNKKKTQTVSRLLNKKDPRQYTKQNSGTTNKSVMSKLNKEQKHKLLLKRKTMRQNTSNQSSSILDDLSSYRKMTMTDRSAIRGGSKITTFRKTNANETERLEDAKYGTVPNSHNDRFSLHQKTQNDHTSSFISMSKTDQNFWKQLERYRNKHLIWIEEKKSLHDKLKKLQRDNDGLNRKVKVLKNQITVGIVNQEGPPDFDLSNIMTLSRHQIDMAARNNISNMMDQSRLMQRLNTSWTRNNLSFSENTNNLPVTRNVSVNEKDPNKFQGQGHGSLGHIPDKNALSYLPLQADKNDLSNVTGFENMFGYTQQFNMDSNNMSLGAITNNAPQSVSGGHSKINDVEHDKSLIGKMMDKNQTKEESNNHNNDTDQQNTSMSNTNGNSKPQSIIEIRNMLKKNIENLENNNQYMQQQLAMQSSFLIDNNEPSQMDMTRMLFGADAAVDISAIDGKNQHLVHSLRRGNTNTQGSNSHARRVSNMSGNTMDQSAFNCEVQDQDESLIGQKRNMVGDNYQMGQRKTLDEIKQNQAQINKQQSKQNSQSQVSEASSAPNFHGPSPTKMKIMGNIGGDAYDFEKDSSPIRISQVSEMPNKQNQENGVGSGGGQDSIGQAEQMLPINALLKQKEQFEQQQRQTAQFNELASSKRFSAANTHEEGPRQSEKNQLNLQNFFGQLNVNQKRGSLQTSLVMPPHQRKSAGKMTDKSGENSDQRGSTKSRNALQLDKQNSFPNKNEVDSPLAIKQFNANDDQTPLRDIQKGTFINALNFNNLVNDKSPPVDANKGRKGLQLHRESVQTADFNRLDYINDQNMDRLKSLRGSIHQVLPGTAVNAVNSGSFAGRPNVQFTMTASDKINPDEPEKTFLSSFSDKINDSVVVKSMDDLSPLNQTKINTTNPEDNQEEPGNKRKLTIDILDQAKSKLAILDQNKSQNYQQLNAQERNLFGQNDQKVTLSPHSVQHVGIGAGGNQHNNTQNSNQNRVFNFDSKSNIGSQDNSSAHFQNKLQESDLQTPVLIQRSSNDPQETNPEGANQEFIEVTRESIDFQYSTSNDKPENQHGSAQQAQRDQQQTSFISHIVKDKDASFAVLSQGNTSMIQNSQYMDASFLVGGQKSSVKSPNQNTPSSSFMQVHQLGQPTPFFAEVKPRNTGVSKMQSDDINKDINTSLIRPLNLDQSINPDQNLNSGQKMAEAEDNQQQIDPFQENEGGTRFTLGQDENNLKSNLAIIQQQIQQQQAASMAGGLGQKLDIDIGQLSQAEAQEIYKLQMQQQILQEQYMQQQQMQQHIQQQLLQQEIMNQQQVYLQQSGLSQYDLQNFHAQQSLLDLPAQNHPLQQQLLSQSNLNSIMTASFAGASHDQLQQLMLSQHMIQQQQRNNQEQYIRKTNQLTQYRNTLAHGQQVDKNHIKNMFIQLVGRPSAAARRDSEPVVSSLHPGMLGGQQQPQPRQSLGQTSSGKQFFESLASKKRQNQQ